MKSKFKFWAFLMGAMSVVFTIMTVMVLSGNVLNSNMSLALFLLSCLFFVFVWLWLIFGEMRRKVISVVIDDKAIEVKRYAGLAFRQHYDFDELDGFETSILTSRAGSYEYLYLIRNQERVVKLSEFYHSNYKELKKEIFRHKIKNLGFKVYNPVDELKEIFT